LQFTAKNWRIFGAGIAAIVLGFILLGTGDITIAPVLLLAGYLVLIPWSLIARPSRPRTEGAPVAESPATPPSSAAEV